MDPDELLDTILEQSHELQIRNSEMDMRPVRNNKVYKLNGIRLNIKIDHREGSMIHDPDNGVLMKLDTTDRINEPGLYEGYKAIHLGHESGWAICTPIPKNSVLISPGYSGCTFALYETFDKDDKGDDIVMGVHIYKGTDGLAFSPNELSHITGWKLIDTWPTTGTLTEELLEQGANNTTFIACRGEEYDGNIRVGKLIIDNQGYALDTQRHDFHFDEERPTPSLK